MDSEWHRIRDEEINEMKESIKESDNNIPLIEANIKSYEDRLREMEHEMLLLQTRLNAKN